RQNRAHTAWRLMNVSTDQKVQFSQALDQSMLNFISGTSKSSDTVKAIKDTTAEHINNITAAWYLALNTPAHAHIGLKKVSTHCTSRSFISQERRQMRANLDRIRTRLSELQLAAATDAEKRPLWDQYSQMRKEYLKQFRKQQGDEQERTNNELLKAE